MAAFNKFQCFVQDVGRGVHNLETGALKVYLSNTAPNAATMAVKADLAEIGAGGNYTAGGYDVAATYSQSGGVGSLVGTDQTITASGGAILTWRYVVLYNSSSSPATNALIGWWDRVTPVDLADGDSVLIDFGATILTVT